MMQPQPHPLDSARLKLTRAGLHLETLKYEVLRFRQSNPYHIVKDIDPETGEQRTYCVIDRQPDHGMALVLGDLVNALHSALDHAVGERADFEGHPGDRRGALCRRDQNGAFREGQSEH